MVQSTPNPSTLARLNAFDATARGRALQRLLQEQSEANATPDRVANMHCHSFYSYSGYGYSPSALAWLAREHQIALMGIVDFDVLDGVDEFLDACELLDVRGSAGLETRVFIPEFDSREINSPGEPGVLYHMGMGFTAAAGAVDSARSQAAVRRAQSRYDRTDQ